MSIEKITSKIVSDAETTAKLTLDEAKAQCDAILAKAQTQAEEIEKISTEKGASEKEKLISRKKAVADIDGRKIILEEKQKLISKCFDRAIDTIANMPKEDYLNFLTATVKNTGIVEGEIILSERDNQTIGEELIERLSKKIPESKIVLSNETRKIKGGFLLKNGSVYINGTIEALVLEAKDELDLEVAKILFQ